MATSGTVGFIGLGNMGGPMALNLVKHGFALTVGSTTSCESARARASRSRRGCRESLKRDFSPGGTVDISFKDEELETAFAKRLGVPVLLANVTQQVYQMARAAGFNKEEDGSALVKVLERLAGVTVGGGERGL
jgi:3-hydroxyisobutyrate dehydrogenase-like beta-hydroxyacid dehydrogenase